MLNIILASFVVMLASLVGVFAIWRRASNFIENNLGFLISFSAGVFVVITYGLVKETLYHSESWQNGIFWITLGTFLVWLLFKIIPTSHHHDLDTNCEHCETCENCNRDNHPNTPHLDARRIILGDGIHNIGDGILLATAFSVNTGLGIVATLSIFAHEIVQEISEFFVMRQAGYSVKKALIVNFLVSATILIGSVGGFFLLENFEVLEIPLLGIAGGTFLIVIVQDLIPHSIRSSDSKMHFFKHFIWFLIGVILMAGVGILTAGGHSHEHGNEHPNENESITENL